MTIDSISIRKLISGIFSTLLLINLNICKSQNCCPGIGPSTLIPQNPTQQSQITILTFIGTNYWSKKVSTSYSVDIQQKKIEIELCYFLDGRLPNPLMHIDTFNIGQLSPGVYTTSVRAYLSTSRSACVTYTQNSSAFTFTIYDNPAGVKDEPNIRNDFLLFPNPTNSVLSVQNGVRKIPIAHFSVYSSDGVEMMCSDLSQTDIDVSGLSPGIYFLLYTIEERIYWNKFMKN